jgi:RNA-binding motif X-linked protein 2
MNPLTQIKNTQKATQREISSGLSESASWHARFRHSAYIFAGGLDYELTEGDLLAVFAQYGEILDVNLVRDKDNGKSKGFAFLAYDDQRSTVVAVDNLNGAKVAGRTIRVEHVDNYRKLKEEVGAARAQDPDGTKQSKGHKAVLNFSEGGSNNQTASPGMGCKAATYCIHCPLVVPICFPGRTTSLDDCRSLCKVKPTSSNPTSSSVQHIHAERWLVTLSTNNHMPLVKATKRRTPRASPLISQLSIKHAGPAMSRSNTPRP